MVYLNLKAVYVSVAMAFPKEPVKGHRLVADSSPILCQYDLVLGPILNPAIESGKHAGNAVFCTMDYFQGYFQFPLAGAVRKYFTFVIRNDLFAPTRVPEEGMNATL